MMTGSFVRWWLKNSHTPPSAWKSCCKIKINMFEQLRFANPNTPKNFQEQIEQLNNPDISQNRLAELATSQWLIICEQVALHPNTPVSLLEELATDKKSPVRRAVAQNLFTPVECFSTLTEDRIGKCGSQLRLIPILL